MRAVCVLPLQLLPTEQSSISSYIPLSSAQATPAEELQSFLDAVGMHIVPNAATEDSIYLSFMQQGLGSSVCALRSTAAVAAAESVHT
jgi:hypothetical protein